MGAYRTILIAGPTASGKSSLAMALAQRLGAAVINADSMQVYRDLRHVTARPTLDDEKQIAHRLYGHVDAGQTYSTGAWLRSVSTMLPQLRDEFETLIFVGGTGLYFNALTLGLSEIPETPHDLRQDLRRQLLQLGSLELYAQLQAEDAASAALLQPADGQRIVRALEVVRHTGQSMRYWQQKSTTPLINLDEQATKAIVLVPDREELKAKISMRFLSMIEAGAMDEVALLMARNLDRNLPAMKAIGVAELASTLSGQVTLESAAKLATISSSQYAKRQATWFRGQMNQRWHRFVTPNAVVREF